MVAPVTVSSQTPCTVVQDSDMDAPDLRVTKCGSDSQISEELTLDLGAVSLRLSHKQSSCLTIQRISWIWVQQQLWQECLKNVQQFCSHKMQM